jgi:quercetin dioxygenase-like cupin family protein
MMTNDDFTGSAESASAIASRNDFGQSARMKQRGVRGSLLRFGCVASLAVLAFTLTGAYSNGANVNSPQLQIIPLAQGSSPEHSVVLHVIGPSDVLQAHLIFPSGSETGWHSHLGPVVVVVNTGYLTEIHKNGCVTLHGPGSVFFEEKDVIHNAVNDGSTPTDIYATFLSPAGAPPLVPASNPGRTCHGNDHDD